MDFWKYNIGDEITAKGIFGVDNVYQVIERRTEFPTIRQGPLFHSKTFLLYIMWNVKSGIIYVMNENEVDSLAMSKGSIVKRNVSDAIKATVKENDANVLKQDNHSGAKSDSVNHPKYYQGKIEVIDFIEDKKLGFNLGNCVKYISRAGKKNPDKLLEDLEKASWYLYREISRIKKGQTETQWLPLPKENHNE